jgi:hypothetical protein
MIGCPTTTKPSTFMKNLQAEGFGQFWVIELRRADTGQLYYSETTSNLNSSKTNATFAYYPKFAT